MFEKRLHFCEHVKYNFKVARLSTCVFKKCSEKNIFTIIFVIRILLESCNPASQPVAQHYIDIGPMYCVIWEVTFPATEIKCQTHRNAAVPANTGQSPNAALMLSQRR